MAGYMAGERRAFETLFARFAPRLHRFFLRSFGNTSVADDMLQTTFLRLHQGRRTYRDGAPVRPWLFTIAARVRSDELRRRHRLPPEADESALDRAEALAEASRDPRAGDPTETGDRVRRALEKLPEAQRIVVHLHRFEGMTFAEIASVLGNTEGAVRVRAFRAYAKLRDNLRDLVEEEPP